MFACGTTLIRNSGAANLGRGTGTAGCLLRPKNGDNTQYLLTAGHVLAPDAYTAATGDPVVAADGTVIGMLDRFLSPSVDGVDAALVKLSVAFSPCLGQLGTPGGWGEVFWPGMELRGFGGVSGQAVTTQFVASGQTVTIPYPRPDGVDQAVSLTGMVTCNSAFQGGDSGTAILNSFGSVVGILIGTETGGRDVICPLDLIIEAFRGRGLELEPVVDRTQTGAPAVPPVDDTATAPSPPRRAFPAPAAPADPAMLPPWAGGLFGAPPDPGGADAADILAWTLWGEANVDFQRAVGDDRMPVRDKAFRAVAEVILNRVHRPGWWGRSVIGVCKFSAPVHQAPDVFQFTCWDPARGGQNQALLAGNDQATRTKEGFPTALWVARNVISGWTGNLTIGATHYYASDIPAPGWADGRTPCVTIGKHRFFNNIP